MLVYGFPMGGDTLSITKGVVSRIEHQNYAHARATCWPVQIDAAINPGNSGGPAIVDGRIVGVAMQGISQADNIGYIVPVPVIGHLHDGPGGRAVRRHSRAWAWSCRTWKTPTCEGKYKVPDDQHRRAGRHGSPAARPPTALLQPGDVLLAVDGHPVADDGTVEFRPRERTSVSYFVQQHQIGETANLEILRDGEALPVEVRLTSRLNQDWLVPMEQYDILPTYYIYGGDRLQPADGESTAIVGRELV